MDFAGAGARSLAWLHGVGGSSRTILEATDRYSSGSLIEAVGFTPERFTSLRVARALAENARRRARQLSPEPGPLFGLGCTATIATDRAKRGDHRCAVAIHSALGSAGYTLTLTKGARDRSGEEELVSLIILKGDRRRQGGARRSRAPPARRGDTRAQLRTAGSLRPLRRRGSALGADPPRGRRGRFRRSAVGSGDLLGLVQSPSPGPPGAGAGRRRAPRPRGAVRAAPGERCQGHPQPLRGLAPGPVSSRAWPRCC